MRTYITDTPKWDVTNYLAKLNSDRGAVCDCGNPDKHGKYVVGEPREHNSRSHAGIYHCRGQVA